MRARDETGSAPAEFVMVSGLLVLLALGVLQLGLALHVRNTLVDAAAEGARFGALADNTALDGADRARDLITAALGEQYAQDVSTSTGSYLGVPALVVTVRAPLPLVGLLGPTALEVAGHAAVETLG
ncbi:MAG: pilus assembly protein TadE [Micrococcales bacterium 70-64]|nr:pilus assembly protein [Leifsonia sp.]ODU65911.1 MAG: pilus assembly protein TadE [Leifsonia sp. SCN 70-46]OJX84537.1 MAG: pilus assembly protein TadE [Micrococcales bacterium 70-64]